VEKPQHSNKKSELASAGDPKKRLLASWPAQMTLFRRAREKAEGKRQRKIINRKL
jgi:hypothetical protein